MHPSPPLLLRHAWVPLQVQLKKSIALNLVQECVLPRLLMSPQVMTGDGDTLSLQRWPVAHAFIHCPTAILERSSCTCLVAFAGCCLCSTVCICHAYSQCPLLLYRMVLQRGGSQIASPNELKSVHVCRLNAMWCSLTYKWRLISI